MKFAASMRYAGLLIDADDCDCNSFRNLGLTCLNCHESVFLVAGSKRQEHKREHKDGKVSHVKASSIPPHFSHRPDKDKTELERCELRSARTTEIDIARSEIAAKNQRIRLFNRHLWNILKMCYKLNDVEDAFIFVQSGFKLALQDYPEAVAQRRYQILIELLVEVYRKEVGRIHAESEMFFDRLIEKTKNHEYTQSESLEALLSLWRQSIDQKMQLQIYNEVIDCLAQKKHLPILEKLIVQGIYNFVVGEGVCREQNLSPPEKLVFLNRLHGKETKLKAKTIQQLFREIDQMNIMQLEAFASFVRDDIIEVVALTPWADGFQRLSDKERL